MSPLFTHPFVRRRSTKTPKHRVSSLCEGNYSPYKGPVVRKMFPFDDVIMGKCTAPLLDIFSRDISFQAAHDNDMLYFVRFHRILYQGVAPINSAFSAWDATLRRYDNVDINIRTQNSHWVHFRFTINHQKLTDRTQQCINYCGSRTILIDWLPSV